MIPKKKKKRFFSILVMNLFLLCLTGCQSFVLDYIKVEIG